MNSDGLDSGAVVVSKNIVLLQVLKNIYLRCSLRSKFFLDNVTNHSVAVS